jgi:hypothetical protein
MTTETEAPTQRPEWGGWVVVVTIDNGDGWVNGIFDNEEEAETHAELERAEGRHAKALTLWMLNADYLHHVEALTYNDEDEDDDEDDETAEPAEWSAGECWKCRAVVHTAHTLCMECLTQQ